MLGALLHRDVQIIRDPKLPMRGVRNASGYLVDEDAALGLPPFWRGVNLIADTIGMLPLVDMVGRVEVQPTPPVFQRPWAEQSRSTTIGNWVRDLLIHGNAIGVLTDFDRAGYPRQIVPVHPSSAGVGRGPDGRLVYRIGAELYSRADVLHVMGPAMSGELVGRSVLDVHTQGIGLATALQDFAAAYFGDSASPTGVIKTATPDLTQDEADELADKWLAKYRQRRRPAVLPAGVEFVPLSSNAEESQLIEARNMSRLEVADMLNLEGDWLGVPNTTRTYANVETRFLNLVRLTLAPWLVKLQDAFSEPSVTPRGHYARFRLSEFLRGDSSRYAQLRVALDAGILTLDEVREMEDLPPLPQEASTDE